MFRLVQQETTMGAILCHIELVDVSVQHMERATMDHQGNRLSKDQQQQLKQLLEDYEMVFITPTTLPSHKSQDHQIPLLEYGKPPNSRPYRYGPV